MNQFNMSNMEIEEFCEALVLDYIRKYNAPTDYIDIRGLITDYLGLEIEFESIVEDDETITAFIANGSRTLKIINNGKVNAFEYRDEVSELILSGLSYAVTGDDNILDAYVIEQKIKDLKQDMEDMITMSMRTEGDTEKFEVEIRKISDQLCAMRSQLEVARTQTQASEKVNQEIESIKMFLADTEINFSEYNEIVVRKLIECIRVMPDGTLVIVLKGGMTIEEQIAA